MFVSEMIQRRPVILISSETKITSNIENEYLGIIGKRVAYLFLFTSHDKISECECQSYDNVKI